MSFLTTRVRAPATDYWNKIVRLVLYLYGTIEIPLSLSSELDSIPIWWVDGSHVVHPNIRGNSGGCMSLESAKPINIRTKRKVNTWSSTEIEIAAAYNFMSIIICMN